MHTNEVLVEQRVDRFIREQIRPAVTRDRVPLTVSAWHVPGEPVPFRAAAEQDYQEVSPGYHWGAPWSTTWFRVQGEAPQRWLAGGQLPSGTSVELAVDLGFSAAQPGFQAEGLVYTDRGAVVKAIQPRNSRVAVPAGQVDFYIEAAGNPQIMDVDAPFVPTRLGDREAMSDPPLYELRGVDLVLHDRQVWELCQDASLLLGLARSLPAGSTRRAGILHALDRMVDVADPEDLWGTASLGRAELAPALASPANASAHHVYAVGHAHIDSAWLWPVRETVRKCARTFSNQLALMDEDPEYHFVASSAQQFAWIEQRYPELFERIKAKVATGQFVPVGSMWVESDTNLPGGEALVRQFLLGKRYFMSRFGVETTEVWLPDSFGYTGALPQIARLAGCRNFLSQKLSWNENDKMPHHTFWWQGIDGSSIFAHFPPVDTYNSDLSPAELLHAEGAFAEKGLASRSLVPFGWGDGGGGPTREMIAAARREADLEGLPTVCLARPDEFFADARAEYLHAPTWVGEMYLEFHRGTYTSQARMKQGNRRMEHLLREVELWSATAAVRGMASYPYDAIEALWQDVLLYQFHDILPGSSIGWVHREAEARYQQMAAEAESLIGGALELLVGPGDRSIEVNAAPHRRGTVPPLGGAAAARPSGVVATREVAGGYELDNGLVRVRIAADGTIGSLRDLVAERELVPDGESANLLRLFRDTPRAWDAWDIDMEYRRSGTDIRTVDELGLSTVGECARVDIVRSFGQSRIAQTVLLRAGSSAIEIVNTIDWREKQKLLKLAFPLGLIADGVVAETQFGHVTRPTHANTTWDASKFEISAHRWIRVDEGGYGVSIANSATYGHDVFQVSPGEGRRPYTMARLSLLRSAVFPDARADHGEHVLTVVLRPGASLPAAIADGYDANLPRRELRGDHGIDPLFSIDAEGILVESVKLAEDRSGDVVVRLYESRGARSRGTLRAGFPHRAVVATDLLERYLATEGVLVEESRVDLDLSPFQIVTLRFRR